MPRAATWQSWCRQAPALRHGQAAPGVLCFQVIGSARKQHHHVAASQEHMISLTLTFSLASASLTPPNAQDMLRSLLNVSVLMRFLWECCGGLMRAVGSNDRRCSSETE